jgi:hypothetical protein
VAKVTQDMKSRGGEVIVAKDTKMMGKVTEAQPRTKDQKESQVAIAFDRAVLKDGSVMNLPMSIQAIIGPENNSGQNNQDASAPSSEPAPGASNGSMHPGSCTASTAPAARPPITAQTQGVIGISDLTLNSTAANATQGSLVTSDKNNVKIESGTMMLLRVNQ